MALADQWEKFVGHGYETWSASSPNSNSWHKESGGGYAGAYVREELVWMYLLRPAF